MEKYNNNEPTHVLQNVATVTVQMTKQSKWINDSREEILREVGYILSEFPAVCRDDKKGMLTARFGNVKLTFPRIYGQNYDRCVVQRARDFLIEAIKKRRRHVLEYVRVLTSEDDEDFDPLEIEKLGFIGDNYYGLHRTYILHELIPCEWGQTNEDLQEKMMRHNTDYSDVSDEEIIIEEPGLDIIEGLLVEPKVEDEEMDIEEEVIQIEPIVQPRLPTKEEDAVIIQEMRERAMREKVKVKQDRLKTKKKRVKFTQRDRNHEPYWDLERIKRGQYFVDSGRRRPRELEALTIMRPNLLKYTIIAGDYDTEDIINGLMDQDTNVRVETMPHRYHRKVIIQDKQPIVTLLPTYSGQYMGIFGDDMALMMEQLAIATVARSNFGEGYISVRDNILKKKKEIHGLALINLLNIPSTRGLDYRHNSMLERTSKRRHFTQVEIDEMVSVRNEVAKNPKQWKKAVSHPLISQVLEYDAMVSTIINMYSEHFRIKQVPPSVDLTCVLERWIRPIPLIEAINTSDGALDLEEVLQRMESAKVPDVEKKGYRRKIADYVKDRSEAMMTALGENIVKGVGSALKALGYESYKYVQGLVSAAFGACADMFHGVIDFVKSCYNKVVNLFRNCMKALGVYDENLKKFDFDAIVCVVVALLLAIYTDNPLVRGACVISILCSLNVYNKVLDAISYLREVWNKNPVLLEETKEKVEFVEAENTSFDILSMFVDYKYGVSALISAVLYVSCGYAATSSQRKSVGGMVVDTLRNIFFVANGVAAIAKLAEAVPELVKKILSLFKSPQSTMSPELKQAVGFAIVVASLNHDEAISAIRVSEEVQKKVLNYTKTWITIKTYTLTKEFQSLHVSIQQCIREAVRVYPKLRNAIYRMKQQAGFRPTTFHIQLSGLPGIGKTTLFKKLVKDIGVQYYPEMSADQLTYSRDSSMEYWNGYANQRIVLCDDLWAVNDAKMFAEIITQVNNCPTPLNMAALEDKNVCYNSDFLISSTNTVYPIVKDIFCMEAIWRRRHILTEVVCDPRVRSPTSGKIEFALFDKYADLKKFVKLGDDGRYGLTDEGKNELPHLKFNILVPVKSSSKQYEEEEAPSRKDVKKESVTPTYYGEKDPLPPGLMHPLKGLKYSDYVQKIFSRYNALRSEERQSGFKQSAYYDLRSTHLFVDECVETLDQAGSLDWLSTGSFEVEPMDYPISPTIREDVEAAFADIEASAIDILEGKDVVFPSVLKDEGIVIHDDLDPDDDALKDAMDRLMAGESIEFTHTSPMPQTPLEILKAAELEAKRRKEILRKHPKHASKAARMNPDNLVEYSPRYILDGEFANHYRMSYGSAIVSVPQDVRLGYPKMVKFKSIVEFNGGRFHVDLIDRIKLSEGLVYIDMSDWKQEMASEMAYQVSQGEHMYWDRAPHCFGLLTDQLLLISMMTMEELKTLIELSAETIKQEEALKGFVKRAYDRLKYRGTRIIDYITSSARYYLNKFLACIMPIFFALYITAYIILIFKVITLAFTPYQQDTSRVMFKAKPKTPYVFTNTSQACAGVENLIQGNSLIMKIGSDPFRGLGIDGSCILTTYHSVAIYAEAGVGFPLEFKIGKNHHDWWHIDVDPKDIYVIPNSDACIIFNKQIPMFRKIIHHFYTDKALEQQELPDTIQMYYIDMDGRTHKDSERVSSIGPMAFNTRMRGKYVMDRTLTYIGDPAIGTSGSAVALYDNYSRYSIVGIQSSKDSRGYGHVSIVSQEDVLKVLKGLTGNVVAEDPVQINTSDVTTRTVELFDAPTRFCGQITPEKVLGVVGKTAFRKTILSDEFQSKREPAVLNAFDPRVEVGTHPMQKSINKYGRHVMRPLPQELLDRAVEDVARYIKMKVQRPRILTVEEAIIGVRGSTPYNLKTSPGIPYIYDKQGYPGKKTWIRKDEEGEIIYLDDNLVRDIHEYIKLMKKGIIPPNQIYEFPKDELRSKEKVLNARSISVQDMRLNIINRMYTLDLMSQLHMCADGEFPMFVGVNPESHAWTRMYKNFSKFPGRCSDADINNWDGHMTVQVMRAATEVVNMIYDDDQENKILRECLGMQIVNAFVQILDVVIHTMRGQKSGSGTTAEINTLAHLILFLTLYYIATQETEYCNFVSFLNYVVLALYGDDLLMSLSPVLGLEPNNMYSLYEHFGWPVSAADKVSLVSDWKDIMDVQFLKRRFICDHKMGTALVYAAIEKDVINDLLHWMRVQHNPNQQLYMNINDALCFAYAHGEVFYEETRERVNGVLRKHRKEEYLTNYREMRSLILGRYF